MSKKDAINALLGNRKSQDLREFVNQTALEVSTTASKKRANFDFDEQLHIELKTFAAQRGKKMVDIVSAAVREYMDNHKT